MKLQCATVAIGVLCASFVLNCVHTSTVQADEPVVTQVTATFDTTTNDKDHDTLLDVSVYNNRNVLIAQKTGIGGHWNDHSSNTVTLDLKNALKKSQIPAGSVRLVIHPNGNDKWEFNYHIDITYSDDSVTEKNWDGKVLTQDNASASDNWNGL
jgi:hypothetical protein